MTDRFSGQITNTHIIQDNNSSTYNIIKQEKGFGNDVGI